MGFRNCTTGFILVVLLLNTDALRGQAKIQAKQARKALMKDTLDGKFDFSRFLIDAHGFIPVPFIITEPALGGLGLAVAPLFLTPKKDLPKTAGYVPPDITAGFAMYTVNGSWALGGGRFGSIPKAGIKYRIGAAYADINMSFYREVSGLGEKKFEFNFQTIPIFGSVSKKITKQGLYAGLQYLFANTKVSPNFDGDIPDFIEEKELDNNIATMGIFLDWDSRNSVFTPDKGMRLHSLYSMDDNWTGSDFTYQRLNFMLNWFYPIKKNWISGLRAEWQQAYGEPPFFLLPYVNLRGIPVARYQGESVLMLETEQRFDLNMRWSILGFMGYGHTNLKNELINQSENVYNLGGGFRYLIARAFKIRTGIDIAKGPDSWGWYIVFGHNWNR